MEHMGLGVFCMKFDFSYHMLLIFVDLPKQTDVCFKTVFPMKNHAVYMYRIKTCLPQSYSGYLSPKNSSDHQDDTTWKTYTLLGINISHQKSLLSRWFSFSRLVGYVIVPWRVVHVLLKATGWCWLWGVICWWKFSSSAATAGTFPGW